jgi:hypothetical protein
MVGRPVPMSRNWRMPASPARKRTARVRNCRDLNAMSTISGNTALTASAISRSAA